MQFGMSTSLFVLAFLLVVAGKELPPLSKDSQPKPLSKEGPVKVAPAKTGPLKVAPAKTGPLKVAPAKEGPLKVAPAKEAPAKEAPLKVAPEKEGPLKVAPAKEAPLKVAPAKEGPLKVAPAKEGPLKVAPAKEAPVKEAPVKEAPAKKAPAKEAPAKEAPAKKAPAKEAPAKEAPAKEDPAKEDPAKEDVFLNKYLSEVCHADISKKCGYLSQGNNAVRKCLQEHKFDADMSTKCKNEVLLDEIKRAEDFKNINFAPWTNEDMVRCLIKNYDDMGESHIENNDCKEEVFGVLKQQAEDIRMAPLLQGKCNDDIEKFCSEIKEGEGRVLNCLKKNLDKLSEQCFNLEFFEIARGAADIRLKPLLLKACRAELQDPALCKDATTGLLQLRCLQDARSNVKMSGGCKKQLINDMIIQSKSMMFRPVLLKTCGKTMSNLCPSEVMQAKAPDGKPLFMDVEHCLIAKFKKIKDDACKAEVKRIEKQMQDDFRLDPEVSTACGADARKFCEHVEMGEGRVHACLQKHLKELSRPCQLNEFKIVAMAMSDMKLNPRLQKACSKELRGLCPDVPSGELFDCLKQNKNDVKMGKMCKTAIQKQLILTRQSWKLRPHLAKACKDDVEKLGCVKESDKVPSCYCYLCRVTKTHSHLPTSTQETLAGTVISCLTEHLKEITAPRCKGLIVEEMKDEAEDVRLQPAEHKACTDDIQKFCDHVSFDKPGEMQHCLRKHLKQLESACQQKVAGQMKKDSQSILFKPLMRRNCRREINTFCSKVQGKDPSVIACLQDNLKDARMSLECKEAVKGDMRESSADVRFSPVITKNCKEDKGADICFKQPHSGSVDHMTLANGSILRCLAEQRFLGKLKRHCEAAVLRQQAIAAKDIRLDKTLNRACHDDQVAFCPEVAPGDGRVLACLRKRFEDLSEDCKSEEFKRQVEAESDVRLNVGLEQNCKHERELFCADVKSDNNGQIIECLQEHRKEKKMSNKCKAAIKNNMKIQSKNVLLNRALLTACFDSFETICNAPNIKKMSGKESAELLNCMLDNRQKVRSKGCKLHLVREMVKRSEDYRLDPSINKNCASDAQFFCSDVGHGKGEVHACLRRNYDGLWAKCRDDEFKEQVRENKDARFLVGFLSACRKDKEHFCAEEDHDSVLPCLEDHKADKKMSPKCRKAIGGVQKKQMKNVEFNAQLFSSCKQTIQKCTKIKEKHDAKAASKAGKNPPFSMLRCVVEHRGEVQDTTCKSQIMREMQKWAFNALLNPEIKSACAADHKKWCFDVEPGEGQLNKCLSKHINDLSGACHEAVYKQQVRESSDIRLNVKLAQSCKKEISSFCKSKSHGDTLACLQDNMYDDDFGARCQKLVLGKLKKAVADPKLNFPLYKVCKEDFARLCAAPDAEDGTQCLIHKKKEIKNKQCKAAVFRQQKLQAQNIELNAEEREACADDTKQFCSDVQSGRGRIHECLRVHMQFLSPECRSSEFEEMENESNDVRLNFPIAVACKTEIAKICIDTSRNNEVEFCLRRNKNHPLMTAGCRAAVEKDQRLALIDIRLQPMIHIHCMQAMKRSCSNIDISFLEDNSKRPNTKNSKQLLQCLIDHIGDIHKPQCKQSVRTLMQNQIEDMSLIDGFSENCHNDVVQFCESERNSKFLFSCLKNRWDKLTPLCATSMRLVINARNAAYNANPGEKSEEEDKGFVLSGSMAVISLITFVVVAAALVLMAGMYLWRAYRMQKPRI